MTDVSATLSGPILPPMARRPEQACALLADAISDGDLDAALMHYEPGAVISPEPGVVLAGTEQIGRMLATAAASREHYTLTAEQVLEAGGLALVIGDWLASAADGGTRAGRFTSVVRLGADGAWRIVTESLG